MSSCWIRSTFPWAAPTRLLLWAMENYIEIRDVNAMNSPILGSFEKTIINVEGANGYTAKPYYVYVPIIIRCKYGYG